MELSSMLPSRAGMGRRKRAVVADGCATVDDTALPPAGVILQFSNSEACEKRAQQRKRGLQAGWWKCDPP